MSGLVWSRLKKMQCPKCNAPMDKDEDGVRCSECDMFMTSAKFEQIINNLYGKRARYTGGQNPDENLSALNNLGHERISEGFSSDEERDL